MWWMLQIALKEVELYTSVKDFDHSSTYAATLYDAHSDLSTQGGESEI